jgi:FkbM family methyltransferase
MSTLVSTADLLRGLLGDGRICVADVGAAAGLAKRWRPLAPSLRVIAFEPDARSDASVDARRGALVTVVDRAAAASDGELTLHLTRKPRCSSLYPPNREVVDRYPDGDRYDVIGTAAVACTTVDTALGALGATLDFLKIDTQGTELDVLRGARGSLDRCLGIEVEVEFQPLYVGAAVFRDVDRYISELGFEIFDLRRTSFVRDGALPRPRQRKGQLVFGDALYFRPWRQVADRRTLIVLATLLLAYGFADVVSEIVRSSPLLADPEREGLAALCRVLEPVTGVAADRKDRFVGTGLQFSEGTP